MASSNDNYDNHSDHAQSPKQHFIEKYLKINKFLQPNPEFPKCVLCKEHFSGTPYGNNAAPLRKRGKCCDKCNHNKVIPARLGEETNPLGSWKFQQLTNQMLFIINHFSDTWKQEVNNDVGLYIMFKNFREKAIEEGKEWTISENGSITIHNCK